MLLKEVVDGVSKWTTNKGIDIFSEKIIFIPDSH
jgi:Ulp1 family protease